MNARRGEADEFWAGVLAGDLTDDERLVSRQALAGMLWSKQYYGLDMEQWLVEHGADPLAAGTGAAQSRLAAPDRRGHHLHAGQVGVPVVRGLGSRLPHGGPRRRRHAVRQAAARPAARTAATCTRTASCRPTSGTSATSTRRCTPGRPGSSTELEKARTGTGDRVFLENAFQKLMRNFGWWLNRKDADDRNIFQGGFLGLDNIGVFDRSAPLPGGGRIDQADGTAWMALYSQNMIQMAVELARENPVYLEQAQSLLENLAWIAAATNHVGPGRDRPVGRGGRLLLRRAAAPGRQLHPAEGALDRRADAARRRDRHQRRGARPISRSWCESAAEFLAQHPAVMAAMPEQGRQADETGPVLFALFDEDRLRRILARMLDEEEFLGPHGIRAVSRWHAEHPYILDAGRAGVQRRLPARPSPTPACSAATPTGADRCGSRSTSCSSGPAEPLRATSATSSRSSARPAPGSSEPVRGRPRDQRPAHRHLPAGTPTAAGRSTAASRSCRTTRTGATWCCSTSTSTATTEPGSAPATRPAGPGTVAVLPLLFRGDRERCEQRGVDPRAARRREPRPRSGRRRRRDDRMARSGRLSTR